MDKIKPIPYANYENVCEQIEKQLTHYMRLEDWSRCKYNIWAFYHALKRFIVCENETAILEEMYDTKMRSFNKAQISKKEFVAYMASDIPVAVGSWVFNEKNKTVCSVCKVSPYEGLDADVWSAWDPQHCPHCGAKMIN